MKSSTRRALLISFCLHLIALTVTFYIVVERRFTEEFTDLLAVDVFTAPNTRERSPKIRTEPIRHVPRQQFTKSTQIYTPKAESIQPTALPTHGKRAIDFTRPRYRLDTAQVAPNVQADLSTAVRSLRADKTALPQTESETSSGIGTKGRKTLGPSGIQQTRNSSILDVSQMGVDGETVTQDPDLDANDGKSIPQPGFDDLMVRLAKGIVEDSEGGPIDVVFVVDSSGSMGDNIRSVRTHLSEMINVYKSAKSDYALGLTTFWALKQVNHIQVSQLTKNLTKYKLDLALIRPRQDENALDAIEQTIREMRFRPASKKYLILVTDEPFTSLKKLDVDKVIAMCHEFDIHTDVLGLMEKQHEALAEKTGGSCYAIPKDPVVQPRQQPSNRAGRSRRNTRTLRHARWEDTVTVGKAFLKNMDTNVVDIILFLDSSKSMEDKLEAFLKPLELMMRDWDNALIDYKLGAVRFSAGGSMNFVNVYHPPQTLDDIRKILALPCQGNEMLLDAVVEGFRKVKLRPGAQPYLIIVTDEPSTGGHSAEAVIQLCLEKGAKVSVIGTFDTFQFKVTEKTKGAWAPIPNGLTANMTHW